MQDVNVVEFKEVVRRKLHEAADHMGGANYLEIIRKLIPVAEQLIEKEGGK